MADPKATTVSDAPAAVAPAAASSPPDAPADSPPTFTFSTVGAAAAPPAAEPVPPADRRLSADEWDASKVPPSRFQKRKGSIYSTPGSRDGHVDSNYAAKFHAKHAELGYTKK